MQQACAACGKPASSGCSGCNLARYCSSQCQRAAWPAHKAVCVPARLQPLARALIVALLGLETNDAMECVARVLGAPSRGAKKGVELLEALFACTYMPPVVTLRTWGPGPVYVVTLPGTFVGAFEDGAAALDALREPLRTGVFPADPVWRVSAGAPSPRYVEWAVAAAHLGLHGEAARVALLAPEDLARRRPVSLPRAPDDLPPHLPVAVYDAERGCVRVQRLGDCGL